MIKLNFVPKTFSSSDFDSKCEICVQGKQVRKPFPSITRKSEPLELIHSDVCDSNIVLTRGSKIYFVTFFDDHSRFRYIYLLKSKDFLTVSKCINSKLRTNLKRKFRF